MTDGCGFINRTALTLIARRFTLPHGMPTAVQGRVAGAKGMFMLHPYDRHPEPRVWIRDSQNKIKLPKLERWHRILDLLKFAQPVSHPLQLSNCHRRPPSAHPHRLRPL